MQYIFTFQFSIIGYATQGCQQHCYGAEGPLTATIYATASQFIVVAMISVNKGLITLLHLCLHSPPSRWKMVKKNWSISPCSITITILYMNIKYKASNYIQKFPKKIANLYYTSFERIYYTATMLFCCSVFGVGHHALLLWGL